MCPKLNFYFNRKVALYSVKKVSERLENSNENFAKNAKEICEDIRNYSKFQVIKKIGIGRGSISLPSCYKL